MFISLLDEARLSPSDNRMKRAEAKSLNTNTTKNDVKVKPEERESFRIIEKLSEYLFDLYDANCMEDFQIVESFEENAVRTAFQDHEVNSQTQYTHEHYRLHKEFLELFEGLIESFLRKELCPVNEFYAHLQACLPNKGYIQSEIPNKDATPSDALVCEVVDVICRFLDFECWMEHMRLRASRMKQYQSFAAQLCNAAVAEHLNSFYNAADKSSVHRLSNCIK